MQTTSSPAKFLHAISNNEAAILETENLRIETSKRKPRTIIANYYEMLNGRWIKFSTCISDCSGDIVADAKHELSCFSIS